MTSPRYPDVEEAWGRFLDGQPRAAAARLSEIVRSGAREGSGFDRRLAALEALGELGATTGAEGPRHLRLLGGETETALTELAVPALAEALDDPDERIRHRACTALRRIGPPGRGALPALRRLAADADGLLGFLARRAILAIEEPGPLR
jgi:HEAT repeat protein